MKRQWFWQYLLPIVSFALILWTVLLYVLRSFSTVYQLGLTTFDFAIVEEAAYRFARGEFLFLTTRGDHALADNQKYLQFLFAIVEWLHLPQPLSLVLLHTFLGLMTGLLVFMIFRRHGFELALVMTALVLWHPMLLNMTFDFIHSEILTPILLLLAYLAWRAQRKWLFLLCMSLALLIKEDVSFTVFALAICYGLSDFFTTRQKFRHWKSLYIFLMVGAVFVFACDLLIILPAFKALTCQYMGLPEAVGKMHAQQPVNPWYSYIFESPHPAQEALKNIFRWKNFFYVVGTCSLLWFWNFRSIFQWALWPALLLNMLSWADYQTSMQYHYDHALIAVLSIGIAEAAAHFSLRQNLRRGALALIILLVAAPFFPETFHLALWGPQKPEFSQAFPTNEYKTLMWLQKHLPEDANISANYFYTSYLMPPAKLLFEFPNPYQRHYFGIYDVCEDWRRSEMPDWWILRPDDEIPREVAAFATGLKKERFGDVMVYAKPEKLEPLYEQYKKEHE